MPATLALAAILALSAGPVRTNDSQKPASQTTTSIVGTSQTSAAQADRIRHAEELLEAGKFADAEPVLKQLAADNPSDERVLFDLGFTQEHNGQDQAAAASYAASIAANPQIAEPHLALGLLEARNGQVSEAHKELDAVTLLKQVNPVSKARALRALARLDQTSAPNHSRDDLAQAIQLTGEQPGDTELTATLAAAAGDSSDAEIALRRELTKNPENLDVRIELASMLQKQNQLAEADALLSPALAAHARDPRLVAQTAALYAAEGKTPESMELLRTLRSSDAQAAQNPGLTRLYAHLLLVSGDASAAEPLYRQLSTAQPADPSLLDDLGSTLVREQKFAEAQTVLDQAVTQREAFHDDQAWADAAGHLAFAASRNHQPAVVLQALQARATVLPNSPSSLFLEATAYDSLHQRKEAERAYRAFLAAANGKLPDEEFEARHRLIALEHEH